jgi:hypothetical protein
MSNKTQKKELSFLENPKIIAMIIKINKKIEAIIEQDKKYLKHNQNNKIFNNK